MTRARRHPGSRTSELASRPERVQHGLTLDSSIVPLTVFEDMRAAHRCDTQRPRPAHPCGHPYPAVHSLLARAQHLRRDTLVAVELLRKISVFPVAAILGCAVPNEDPAAEEIWTLTGGLRDPCDYRSLYRSGMRVEHREYEDCELIASQKGTLTDDGLAEYITASASLSPGQELPSCLAWDGVDAKATAFDGADTFEVRYCISADGHAAARLEKFFFTLRTGLEECSSHEWFDAC